MTQYEREEEQLERDLADGLISLAEFNKQVRDMQRDMRDEARSCAEEAAERAYRDTMDRF